jgi:formate hydrogenlyase transcriptional activator
LTLLFVQRYAKRIGRTIAGVSRDSMERLATYQWPGNVRELENVIERALVLSAGDVLEIGTELLPKVLPSETHALAASAASITAPMPERPRPTPMERAEAAPNSLDDVQRVHISATLDQTGWVIEGPRGAARILNLHPNTLRSRMKKLGLTRG